MHKSVSLAYEPSSARESVRENVCVLSPQMWAAFVLTICGKRCSLQHIFGREKGYIYIYVNIYIYMYKYIYLYV